MGQPDALAVVNPRSRLLGDPTRRAAVEAEIRAAVRTRTGSDLAWADGDPTMLSEALDAAIAARAPLVVVVGGDGTIRIAAERLIGTGIPLAVVPGGTGNLFSGALGLPIRRATAVRAIAEGGEIDVDVGRVKWALAEPAHGRAPAGSGSFVVGCGSGFDAQVMAAASEAAKRTVGRAAYFAAAAALVPGISVLPHRITVDGETHETDALAVLVANAGELIPGLVGPRLPISATDGLLDVLVIRARSVVGGVVGALELLARTSVGWSTTGTSLRLRGRRVEVFSDPPEVIEVDGDVLGRGSFVAEALPGALRVVHLHARGGEA